MAVSGGTPDRDVAEFWNGAIPWISPKDFGKYETDSCEEYITERGVQSRRLILFEPDTVLIVVRSGILRHSLPVTRLRVAATINQDVKALIPKTPEINPMFLAAYLEVRQIDVLARVVKHSTTVQSINTDQLYDLLIPTPPPNIQQKLVIALDTFRAQYLRKLKQADDLLAGLDSFVLDALGLILPPPDGKIVYGTRLGDTRQRFDADYHCPHFRALRQKINDGKYPVGLVGQLFDPIVSGFAAGADAQTDDPESGVPHIRPLNITNTAELILEGTKMVPRSTLRSSDYLTSNELLFNNTNSTTWVGKSVVFDIDRECACSNHITRMTLIEKDHSPYFFAALFNALRGLGFFGLLATNFNNQAGINVATLKAIHIPVPDRVIQREIAAEIARRRAKARQLRNDAEQLWNDAKRRFEEELLGPQPAPEIPGADDKQGGSRR